MEGKANVMRKDQFYAMIALFAGASVADQFMKFFRWVQVEVVIAVVEPECDVERRENKSICEETKAVSMYR